MGRTGRMRRCKEEERRRGKGGYRVVVVGPSGTRGRGVDGKMVRGSRRSRGREGGRGKEDEGGLGGDVMARGGP